MRSIARSQPKKSPLGRFFDIIKLMRNKFLKKIKYPKFILLIIVFLFTYLVFANIGNEFLYSPLLALGYFGIFLAGILYAYGFTAGVATALLLILSKENNIFLAALIGGFGALLGDFVIFKFIRSSFKDELNKLGKEKIFSSLIKKSWFKYVKKYFIPAVGIVAISSPLPDEIGVTLLASSKIITSRIFPFISYILNTAGICVILLIGGS